MGISIIKVKNRNGFLDNKINPKNDIDEHIYTG
jgi:hypothetical protein